MELTQLIYFSTTAEYKSISKAAEAMHVSQPTVSIAIRKLEEELGLPLFDHSKKPIQLTAYGETLLPRVDSILYEIKNIRSEAADFIQNAKTSIRFGLPLTLCNQLIHHLKKDFCTENNNIELLFYQYGTEEIAKKVSAEQLDIGITCIPSFPELNYTPLKEVEFYAYFSSLSPLADKELLSSEDLSGKTLLITDSTSSEIEQNIIAYLKKEKVNVRYSYSGLLSPNAALILAELGEGIALLSKNVKIDSYDLIKKQLNPPLLIPLCITWNKNLYLTQAHKKLIRFIKQSDFIFT